MGALADALVEKSKDDNAMIVGSEIRAAIGELQDAILAFQEKCPHVQAYVVEKEDEGHRVDQHVCSTCRKIVFEAYRRRRGGS